MINSTENHTINRRAFLRQAACAALGATAMVNTLSSLQLTTAALAQGSSLGSAEDDYRALVCIFLAGGNDSNNILIPGSTSLFRDDYVQGRGALAIADEMLTETNTLAFMPEAQNAFRDNYGDVSINDLSMHTHPNAPEIAELFNAEKLSFVCNVGTLAEPIANRADYLNGKVALPKDLFSHSDQQMEWQTSVADSASATGWGGRVADILHEANRNPDSKASMSISIAGINTFLRSDMAMTKPLSIGTKGIQSLTGFGNGADPYANAYESDRSYENPAYQDNRAGARLQTLENLVRLSRENLMADSYAGTIGNARILSETVDEALTLAETKEVDFDLNFMNAQTKLGDQLKMVTKLIAGREKLGNQRQIFFVSVGGYDIHKNHLESHAELMSELSTGLMAFHNTLEQLGDWDKVVAFTASDFNRTLSPNSADPSAGTDHAWGGHSIVMGGPVKGKNLFGQYPLLRMGGEESDASVDADENGKARGRWIPAVSVDQYSAVMANWLGVESSALDEIFPNLRRFDDPLASDTPNLNFLT